MACGLLLTARPALFWDITHRGEASYIAEEDKTCVLGTFTKLRKSTVSLIVSVRPSVCMGQLVFHSTDIH
jgi:hypothetical protein